MTYADTDGQAHPAATTSRWLSPASTHSSTHRSIPPRPATAPWLPPSREADRRHRVPTTAHAAVDVTFKSGSTSVTGAFGLGANGSMSYAGAPDAPAFETARGNALILNLSGAVQTSGHVSYTEG